MPKSRSFTTSRVAVALDEHDVLGLEIAVDDAGGVRVLERAQDLAHDGERALAAAAGPPSISSAQRRAR